MNTPAPLNPDEIRDALQSLDGWTVDGNALAKTFTFDDFREAMGAMVRIGFEAETLNHHPELRNVYNTVAVRLTTHDADDSITDSDVQLARRIDAVVGR